MTPRAENPEARNVDSLSAEKLDRHSFVPLYYQLQEVLKEHIESGAWQPGEALPSEPELAREFGISRVVVRQALAILEDDRQIYRVRGRGTFVATPKLDSRAGGLCRMLASPRSSDVALLVLEKREVVPEASIRKRLQASGQEAILRVTTQLSLRDVPLAISYSFFRRGEVGWLDEALHTGRAVPPDLTLPANLELAHSQASVETSQCGQFEADRFGVPHRTSVFLALCTEYRKEPGGTSPFEVARVEYRGDLVQLRLNMIGEQSGELEAHLSLNDSFGDRRAHP